MNFKYTPFVRKPFVVEAVEITKENIEEVAPMVGELCFKEDGSPFIKADRRLVQNSYRVYPGFFLTKMGTKTRCYSRRVFLDQFAETTPEIMVWVDYMNETDSPAIVVVNPIETVEEGHTLEPYLHGTDAGL